MKDSSDSVKTEENLFERSNVRWHAVKYTHITIACTDEPIQANTCVSIRAHGELSHYTHETAPFNQRLQQRDDADVQLGNTGVIKTSIGHGLADVCLPNTTSQHGHTRLTRPKSCFYCTAGFLSFGPMAQCVVHALEDLA